MKKPTKNNSNRSDSISLTGRPSNSFVGNAIEDCPFPIVMLIISCKAFESFSIP
jgi:hypothetical protein